MRSVDLASKSVVFGNRPRPLLELVDSWCRHVLRLAREADAEDADLAWGVHDYVAALCIRDAVDEGLGGQGAVPATIEIADELFLRFTRPDDQDRLRLVEPPRDQWWWHRVPTTGPVAAELVEIATRSDRPDRRA